MYTNCCYKSCIGFLVKVGCCIPLFECCCCNNSLSSWEKKIGIVLITYSFVDGVYKLLVHRKSKVCYRLEFIEDQFLCCIDLGKVSIRT